MALLTSPGAAPAAPAGGAPVRGAADRPLVPFERASRQRNEPMDDRTWTIGPNTQASPSVDIPANGFLRHVLLHVTQSAGTGVVAVAATDAPWSVFNSIELQDVNGAPLVGPYTGYELYLANKYGAYAFQTDPKSSPAFSAVSTAGAFGFILRIPVEISGRDALGSLPNQNASQTFKLRYTIAAKGDIFTTDPTTFGALRVRVWTETWAPPAGTDGLGNPQEEVPYGVGTTQFWARTVFNVAVGQQTIRLSRVGNLIRTLVFVTRNAAGVRVDSIFPDPFRFELDANVAVNNESALLRRHYMAEAYNLAGAIDTAGALDTGVYVLFYSADLDGKPGYEMRDHYLATSQASRLDLLGSVGVAGTISVLTNDISTPGGAYV